MKIDCISDLHGHYPQLEGGDLLIVAGDLTAQDTAEQHIDFQIWLNDQDYSKKVVVAGNHDNRLQKLPFKAVEKQYEEMGENYLCDSGIQWCGLRIWGSPWTKRFAGENPKCLAFTCETEEELAEHWKCIPDDTDILVTHSPPKGYLDQVIMGKHVGSESLFDWWYSSKARLRMWCFGHIHESYGKIEMNHYYSSGRLTLLNASHVNERYEPVNKPVRINL